jgi:hypothetical protein
MRNDSASPAWRSPLQLKDLKPLTQFSDGPEQAGQQTLTDIFWLTELWDAVTPAATKCQVSIGITSESFASIFFRADIFFRCN